MTTKPRPVYNNHHFIASFEGGYDATGDISTYSHETCNVCKATNVPCLAIDSSEGEYGPGLICAKCINTLVLPLITLDPSPVPVPNPLLSETYEERGPKEI